MPILTLEQVRERYKNVFISQGAAIHTGVEVYQGAVIGAGTEIKAGTEIHRGARIGKNRKNVGENIVISGIGNTKNITAYVCDDGLIINISCVNDYSGLPLTQMRKLIAKKYKLDHEYFLAMDLIEKWHENLTK